VNLSRYAMQSPMLSKRWPRFILRRRMARVLGTVIVSNPLGGIWYDRAAANNSDLR